MKNKNNNEIKRNRQIKRRIAIRPVVYLTVTIEG